MNKRRSIFGGRWWLPIWCAGVGVVLVAAQAIAGNGGSAAITAVIFALATIGFLAAERTEALRGLGGTQGDERFERIEITSMAVAGRFMAAAVLIGWAVEVARGNDGAPYAWVIGVGTLAYLGSMVWLRRRM